MYYYKVPKDHDQQPEWFRHLLRKVIATDRVLDRTWVWNWNDTYDQKITIREGQVHIIFDREEDLTLFILRET